MQTDSLTPDSVIDALGGTCVVADELGLKPPTVSGWRTRGIPPKRSRDIVELARKKGCSHITFEALAGAQPEEARA